MSLLYWWLMQTVSQDCNNSVRMRTAVKALSFCEMNWTPKDVIDRLLKYRRLALHWIAKCAVNRLFRKPKTRTALNCQMCGQPVAWKPKTSALRWTFSKAWFHTQQSFPKYRTFSHNRNSQESQFTICLSGSTRWRYLLQSRSVLFFL